MFKHCPEWYKLVLRGRLSTPAVMQTHHCSVEDEESRFYTQKLQRQCVRCSLSNRLTDLAHFTCTAVSSLQQFFLSLSFPFLSLTYLLHQRRRASLYHCAGTTDRQQCVINRTSRRRRRALSTCRPTDLPTCRAPATAAAAAGATLNIQHAS